MVVSGQDVLGADPPAGHGYPDVDRPGPFDLIGHDAVGLGHAGRADWYRDCGDGGQVHRHHADHTHLPPYFSDAIPARRQGD